MEPRIAILQILQIMFRGWKIHEESWDAVKADYTRDKVACMIEAAGGDEAVGYTVHLMDHWGNDLQDVSPLFGVELTRDAEGKIIVGECAPLPWGTVFSPTSKEEKTDG